MSSISAMSSYFTELVSQMMEIERQPLTQLKTERDTLSTKSSIYTDVSTKIKELQDAVKVLKSTASSPAIVSGRTLSISDVATGSTVVTASASSSAMTGKYSLSVTSLAREHRVRSDQQLYSDQALGRSGTILLGGAAERAAQNQQTNSMVTGLSTGTTIVSGQSELGTGKYYVETRTEGSTKQFRLVDAEGTAISIQKADKAGEFTTGWQDASLASGGTLDTGRGLVIQLDSSASFSATTRPGEGATVAAGLDYIAKGVSLEISATDSLNTIAARINEKKFPDGNGISATVVDRQLVLSAAASGVNHRIIASGSVLQELGILGEDEQINAKDLTGYDDNFKHTLQAPNSAVFTVNGLEVTRSKNTGLTDVVSGITLNLAADSEGKSATISVASDFSGAKTAIEDFVSKFNTLQNYLALKTGVFEEDSGEKKTYSRGALADDFIFSDLRSNLFQKFVNSFNVTSAFTSLRQIGITIDDNLKASVSDSSKLENALKNNFSDVTSLMDGMVSSFDAELSRFTGTGGTEQGYIYNASTNLSNQLKDLDESIDSMESRLVERQAYYTNQYAEMQAQLINLAYAQQTWQSIYGSYSSSG